MRVYPRGLQITVRLHEELLEKTFSDSLFFLPVGGGIYQVYPLSVFTFSVLGIKAMVWYMLGTTFPGPHQSL